VGKKIKSKLPKIIHIITVLLEEMLITLCQMERSVNVRISVPNYRENQRAMLNLWAVIDIDCHIGHLSVNVSSASNQMSLLYK